jgi:hypothetical protein
MCKEQGCKTRPYYNLEGETKPIYCLQHKKEGMVDVKNKTCIHEGCKKQPGFNIKDETKAIYCSTHKKEGMVNIIAKTCIYEGCKTIPTYNLEGETTCLYCAKHKLKGMINIKHKTCIHEGCKTLPIYNLEGLTKPIYCSSHKKEGMVDVIHKTCIYEGCKTRPYFNIKGLTKEIYCFTHKKEGMVDVKNKTCIHEGCKTRPYFNIKGNTKPIYCLTHKKEEMENIISKTCKSEWCFTKVTKKYDGYCLFCFMNLFPDKPVSRNYKTKEYAVVEYIKNKYPNLNWMTDKIINGGCSKRRPDLLLDLLYQVIIIEVDENQHVDYDCSCQNKRVMQLSQDLGHRPIIFIRFNPDDYQKDGITITSCWGQDKKGICVIKKSKKGEWTHRLNILENHINYWINPENITNKTVETIQLFYDI